MSVRSLYRYVLASITKPHFHQPKDAHPSASADGQQKDVKFQLPNVNTRRATVWQVDAAAAARLAEHEGDITYRERLGGWLHPRDMRRLVTPFSSSNEPGVIVRRHVMLFNYDPLRAVILRDRLLVLYVHSDHAARNIY
jgi:hypothetical protein